MYKSFQNIGVFFVFFNLLAFQSQTAIAQSESKSGFLNDTSVSVGVKTWNAEWHGNNLMRVGSSNLLTHMDSPAVTAVIPFVAFKFKDYGLSMSTLTPTSFNSSDGLAVGSTSRREYDLNAIYYVIPGVTISAGYKSIAWTGVEINGYTIASSFSAPITQQLGIYGTGGIGSLTNKYTAQGGSDASSYSGTSFASTYSLVEAGISYSIGKLGNFSKSTAVTAGYRTQRIRVPISTLGSGNADDNTSGITLAAILSF